LEVLKGIFRGSLIFTTINLIIDFGELFMNRLIDYSSRFRILKGGKISLVVSALLGSVTLSFAAPSGGTVTTGSATISQSGSVTNIDQSTNKASINWQSFNIGSNETVNFNQPSSSSITLNRVVGATSSLIQGAMNANGQVFLVNPNGVLFSNGSQVNVAGLVATTKNITDEDFQNGNYNFSGDSEASILNQGTINATNGYVALLGKTVSNEGTITATLGNVQLAGGKRFALQIDGNSLVNLTIDEAQLNSLVENKGAIIADGGKVHLTTQAVNDILDGMVNNTGVIQANSLSTNENGEVILFAHGGTANIDGTLKADFVETSGKKVKIAETTTVDTNGGEWLIDPVDFTIAATGGDMTGTTLSSNLGSNSVTIQSTNGASGTDGDINVNDAITWTSGNTLTLNAQGDININENIDASGGSGGKLVLEYGQGAGATGNTASYNIDTANNKTVNLQAGQNFDTKLGSDGTTINWEVVTQLGVEGDATAGSTNSGSITLQGLDMSANFTKNIVLGANIDASATSTWNSGAGFDSIGNSNLVTPNSTAAGTIFEGRFDGLGHSINSLYINRPTKSVVGLFDNIQSMPSIRNLYFWNGNITGGESYVGMLAGYGKYTIDASIENILVSGSVTGTSTGNFGMTGGVVGQLSNTSGTTLTLDTIGSVAIVSGNQAVGGIFGASYIQGSANIDTLFYNGTLTAADQFGGGIIGYIYTNEASTLSNISSNGTVNVTGNYAGGVFGYFENNAAATISDITNNAALTSTNSNYSGGIAGYYGAWADPIVLSSLTNTGTIIGDGEYTGGIAGYIGIWLTDITTSNIVNSGDVTGNDSYVAGVFGKLDNYSTSAITIADLSSSGNVVGDGGYDGLAGVIGYVEAQNGSNTVTFDTLVNTGTVSTASEDPYYIGGVIGGIYGDQNAYYTIANSHSTGEIDAWDSYGYVGGLVGDAEYVNIDNSYSTGIVKGDEDYVGGLIGHGQWINITDSYATGDVIINDADGIGGFAGDLRHITIETSYATGNIDVSENNNEEVGGFIGALMFGNLADGTFYIRDSYATGNVIDSGKRAGGFIGSLQSGTGTIERSYATGDVDSTSYSVGGFVGNVLSSSGNQENYIKNSYATGDVTGTTTANACGVGGFIGTARSMKVENSYSVGSVTDTGVGTYVGGFIGISADAHNTFINNFWDTETSGQTNAYYDKPFGTMTDSPTIGTVGEVEGKTTAEMQKLAIFGTATPAWDIVVDDSLVDVYPQLRWATSGLSAGSSVWVIGKTGINYSVAGGTKTYGQAFTLPTPSYTGGTPTGTSTVKVYDAQNNDVTSQAIAGTLPVGTYTVKTLLTDTNYAIANSGNTDGTLTIGQANVNYTVADDTKTYGEAFTLPTPSYTGGTPSGTSTVKVYDAQNNDVTSQAIAGTLPAGTYTVKTELSDTNYAIANSGNTDGILTIGQANLNYTVTGGTKTYGEAFTLPTPSFTGGTPTGTPTVKVYDGETDVTAQAIAGTLPAGTYTVKTELSDTNYAIANSGNTDGTLTIGQANLNYTVTGGTKTYGEAFTLPTPSITGGTPSATPTVKVYDGETDVTAQAIAGTLSAGTYTVKVTLNDTNYIISTTGNTDGTLTINSAIEIQDIITNIVNATTVKAPVVVAPKTPDQPVAGFERKVASAIVNNTPAITTDNTLPSANIGLNELIRDVKPEVNDVVQNNRLTLVSDSGGEEKITTVDMESLMAKSGGGELRVALSPDSFVELVNGGVNLPSGVSQEFYVVEDQQ
jgi:filamentous hemagglutinin family protein